MTGILVALAVLTAVALWPVKRGPRVRPIDPRRQMPLTAGQAVWVDWPTPMLVVIDGHRFRAVSLESAEEQP